MCRLMIVGTATALFAGLCLMAMSSRFFNGWGAEKIGLYLVILRTYVLKTVIGFVFVCLNWRLYKEKAHNKGKRLVKDVIYEEILYEIIKGESPVTRTPHEE